MNATGSHPVPAGAQLIDGPVEARKAAREQLDNGADWIKVYMVAPNALADLVAVPGNPLDGIHVLEKVQFVMKDGAVFKH